ncbi:hypothetical protein JEQ12_005408 [Ovis aries]|uniref:E3 ubiquitin-protein ligase CBL n=1 Tax=Ovis aries TaxID=9940 RepID=A0A836A430_SHEEP|nr:hypothetical protein JEQ12_005408 [Ovis aries]
MAAVAQRGRQWGESRALGRAVRLLQRLEERCGDPRLSSSPPSLRDLLPRTAQLLHQVAQARQDASGGVPEGPGGAWDFLVVYLANLEAKSRQVAALLPPPGRKIANDELFREGSRLRRQLAKLALIFSYMHAELAALFPGGRYCGHTYQLTEVSAHTFWRERCGARCVLPWAEFEAVLSICHPVEPGSTALALRSTIDFTCSGHVSIFEFDIFTRLFQPWPTLLKNWQLLAVNHPGYMAFLTYDEVRARLQTFRDKPGSYIFRPSCTRLGKWAIGYVSSDGSILQTIPLNKPLFQVLLEGQKEGFYLYPDGKTHNPDLTKLCHMEPHQHIHVSEEQLQLYWAMDSTFELCKICAESNKDVKIEPCGHLLCSRCLAAWLCSDSQTCPFCRCEIKGQEAVSIHQFQVSTVVEDPEHSSDEEELGQMAASGPPLPPRLDLRPKSPSSKGQLEVVDRSWARHRLAWAELHGSKLWDKDLSSQGRSPPYQLDSRGRLVLPEAQVGDERDYVCVVKTGAAGIAEATARLSVFAKPEAPEVSPNKGTLSVMDDFAQEIATCSSRNGNPAPKIMWYRNGQPLAVPLEVNSEGYMTARTVREASGLLSVTSTLYLRLHKPDREASFHCSVHYHLPAGQHGRQDSPSFSLTLHYPTESVLFWLGSQSIAEGWVREGDSVQLLCQGDGSPSPEYTFFRLQDKQEDVLKTSLEGNLTLERVQRNQSGTYGCRVEDYDAPEDADLSKTLDLRVAYLDSLELSTGEELSLSLSNSTTVTCSARGLPTPILHWTKDSAPMGEDPTLSLHSVTFDSAGTYTCEAYMPNIPLLSRTRSFRLLVQGTPELKAKETQPKAEGSWTEGDKVTLICYARGYPEPKLTWSQLGGSPTEPAPGGQGWVSSSLTLKVTSALSQDGVSCEASNPLGNTHHVFHFGTVAPQTSQAGVAVMAVAISVGLLLLVVAVFYCMRRKGRPGCCRRSEKGPPPPGEPKLSHSGKEQPEQTGLLMGSTSGGAKHGSRGFGDEC